MSASPSEVIGNATLYLGDCKDILPSLNLFDVCLTDPPYGIGKDGQIKTSGGHGGRKEFEFLGWDSSRPGKDLFDLIRMKSKHQIIWGGNYFSDFLPATSKWFVWDKGQRMNQSDGELAWTSFEGALRILTINRKQIDLDQSVHPTQKPVPLMNWCIDQIDKNFETFVDPFMGSGTTGVACMNSGKKFVGIEKEPKYFEIACNRIRKAESQGNLFFKKKERKPEQVELPLAV